jgi:hypothetical protein
MTNIHTTPRSSNTPYDSTVSRSNHFHPPAEQHQTQLHLRSHSQDRTRKTGLSSFVRCTPQSPHLAPSNTTSRHLVARRSAHDPPPDRGPVARTCLSAGLVSAGISMAQGRFPPSQQAALQPDAPTRGRLYLAAHASALLCPAGHADHAAAMSFRFDSAVPAANRRYPCRVVAYPSLQGGDSTRSAPGAYPRNSLN